MYQVHISNATITSFFASYMSVSKGSVYLIRIIYMTNIRKTIISIAAAVLALVAVSCQKDDTLYYNNLTMGNIVDGRFVSDQGNTFNVIEQMCTGKLEEQSRAMVLCDVLNETKGASKEYDIRLTSFTPVVTKDAVALEDAAEGEIAVQNPVHIDQLWFSGGYMNMLIKFHYNEDNDQKHLVNLVWSKDEEGKYILNFRHNAYGEVWSKENSSKLTISGGYVSFPINSFINEDEATIVLNWKWYKSPGVGYDFTTEKDYSFEYEWKRSGFEQVPNNLTLKSTAEIL